MNDNNYAPIWDGNYLILLSATPILYVGSWQQNLEVMYPDPDSNFEFQSKHFYDYVGVSLRYSKNNHSATNSWLHTIPEEVRTLCGMYPSNQFFLARVAAIDLKYFELARRNFVVYVIWLEHCRRNEISREVLLSVLVRGEQYILSNLQVNRMDQALLVCKCMEKNVVSGIPPEYILDCLKDESRLTALSKLEIITKRHFTQLATRKNHAARE
jgi:hypothetical protein